MKDQESEPPTSHTASGCTTREEMLTWQSICQAMVRSVAIVATPLTFLVGFMTSA